jgi:hypothetical protein
MLKGTFGATSQEVGMDYLLRSEAVSSEGHVNGVVVDLLVGITP